MANAELEHPERNSPFGIRQSSFAIRRGVDRMIEGVIVHPLKQIPDERGKVMHMLKATDPHFERFGEIYFSMVYPGVVKGWHRHARMTLNYAVVIGTIKLVLYDDRTGSPTQGKLEELFVGDSNYCLVKVPPGIWDRKSVV